MSPMCPLPAGKGCKRGQRCRCVPALERGRNGGTSAKETQQRAAENNHVQHESGGSQHPGRRKWHNVLHNVLHWPKQSTLR